jgi:hypothetical protein
MPDPQFFGEERSPERDRPALDTRSVLNRFSTTEQSVGFACDPDDGEDGGEDRG